MYPVAALACVHLLAWPLRWPCLVVAYRVFSSFLAEQGKARQTGFRSERPCNRSFLYPIGVVVGKSCIAESVDAFFVRGFARLNDLLCYCRLLSRSSHARSVCGRCFVGGSPDCSRRFEASNGSKQAPCVATYRQYGYFSRCHALNLRSRGHFESDSRTRPEREGEGERQHASASVQYFGLARDDQGLVETRKGRLDLTDRKGGQDKTIGRGESNEPAHAVAISRTCHHHITHGVLASKTETS